MYSKMLWLGEDPTHQGLKASYVSRFSVFGLLIYMILIIAGSMIQEGRVCGISQVLQLATCVNCETHNCLKCDFGSSICNECEVGYDLQFNKCFNCDKRCSVCDDGTQKCYECKKGYRLEDGECVTCDQEKCDSCDKD